LRESFFVSFISAQAVTLSLSKGNSFPSSLYHRVIPAQAGIQPVLIIYLLLHLIASLRFAFKGTGFLPAQE